jgi:hypothetical protein
MYAIINFTRQTTQFYSTFAAASAACTNYNVAGDSVYVVSIPDSAVEKL